VIALILKKSKNKKIDQNDDNSVQNLHDSQSEQALPSFLRRTTSQTVLHSSQSEQILSSKQQYLKQNIEFQEIKNQELFSITERHESRTASDYGWFETEDTFHRHPYGDQFSVLQRIDGFREQDPQSLLFQLGSSIAINKIGDQSKGTIASENCETQTTSTRNRNVNTIKILTRNSESGTITPTSSIASPFSRNSLYQGGFITKLYLEKNYPISTKCFSLPDKTQITVACAIVGFRVMKRSSKKLSKKPSSHAEYQVVVCSGDKTFSAWRRYSHFAKLANYIFKLCERSGTKALRKTVNAWLALQQNMPWFRCLDFQYLFTKYQKLDIFFRELLLELSSPNILLQFVTSNLSDNDHSS